MPRSPNATYTRHGDHNRHNREMYSENYHNPYREIFIRLRKERMNEKKEQETLLHFLRGAYGYGAQGDECHTLYQEAKAWLTELLATHNQDMIRELIQEVEKRIQELEASEDYDHTTNDGLYSFKWYLLQIIK